MGIARIVLIPISSTRRRLSKVIQLLIVACKKRRKCFTLHPARPRPPPTPTRRKHYQFQNTERVWGSERIHELRKQGPGQLYKHQRLRYMYHVLMPSLHVLPPGGSFSHAWETATDKRPIAVPDHYRLKRPSNAEPGPQLTVSKDNRLKKKRTALVANQCRLGD